MGRKKIQISRITDERNRQVTFNKRKFGVMKKAYELSVLCDCEIALIIFSSSNKLYQYASTDMDKVLLKYTEYNEPHESLTNKNIIEALSKKEHKNGPCSPDSQDNDSEFQLTPNTEAKYDKIDEAFQIMMQKNQISRQQQLEVPSYPLPLNVSTSSYNNSSLLPTSPNVGQNNVSPRPSSSEAESGTSTRKEMVTLPPGRLFHYFHSASLSDLTQFLEPFYGGGGSMLDMSNGFPNSSSSPGRRGSLSPGPSPVPGNMHNMKITESNSHSSSSTASSSTRPNLKVAIPSNQQSDANSRNNSSHTVALNTPVVALQTPTLSSYTNLFPDMNSSTDLSIGSMNWPSMHQNHSNPLHLSVSNSSPVTSSPSPSSVHVKSEPNSPPRPDHHLVQHMLHSAHAALASQHLVPGSSLASAAVATNMRHEYDGGPASKRPREWGP